MSDMVFTTEITLVEEEYEELMKNQELLIELYNRVRLSCVSDDKHDKMLLQMDRFIHDMHWNLE